MINSCIPTVNCINDVLTASVLRDNNLKRSSIMINGTFIKLYLDLYIYLDDKKNQEISMF